MSEVEINETLEVVHGFLGEVIGEEFIDEYEIELESTLTGDLEMESIEIVELAQKVKAKYGETGDMSVWMAKLSLEQLVKLTVGDIVKFISDAQA
ncbi:MAG: acyl carrier protein [Flavobacteriales bacterium]|jgi:acyl carrier protein